MNNYMSLLKYRETFIKLIKQGITAEVIANQLGCTIDEVEKVINSDKSQPEIKKETQAQPRRKKKPAIHQEAQPNEQQDKQGEPKSRLDIMREKYKKLYKTLELPIEDMIDNPKYVRDVMEKIKALFMDLQKAETVKERGDDLQKIGKYIKIIKSHEIPEECCDFLIGILNHQSVKALYNAFISDTKGRTIVQEAITIVDKCKSSVLVKKASQSNDLEEIKRIIAAFDNIDDTKFDINGRKRAIERKRDELINAENKKKKKTNINPETDTILQKLISGSVTKEEFDCYINEEIERRLNKAPKLAPFRDVTNIRNQIFINLRFFLTEMGNTYKIKDIKRFEQVWNSVLDKDSQGLRGYIPLVVSNMLANGEYNRASKFCDDYITEEYCGGKKYLIYKCAQEEKRRVALAELGSMILNKLNHKVSLKDDERFLQELLKRLKAFKNVGVNRIKLGKNAFESREITLFDIWDNTQERLTLTRDRVGK